MKINEILECFNKVLYEKKINGFFVSHSNWERKFGPIKRAYTEIHYIKNGGEPQQIAFSEYTTNLLPGNEEELIAETERRAIKEMIKYWTDNLFNNDRKSK